MHAAGHPIATCPATAPRMISAPVANVFSGIDIFSPRRQRRPVSAPVRGQRGRDQRVTGAAMPLPGAGLPGVAPGPGLASSASGAPMLTSSSMTARRHTAL